MTNGINTDEENEKFRLIYKFYHGIDRFNPGKEFVEGLNKLYKLQKENFESFLMSPETKNLENLVDSSIDMKFYQDKLLFTNLETIHNTKEETMFGETITTSNNQSDLLESIPTAFALYTTLKTIEPDKVLTIAKSAIPFATLTKFFGYETGFISAHRENDFKNKSTVVKEFKNTPNISTKDRILIIDEHSDVGKETTYGLVKDYLINNKNIDSENITVYLGREKVFDILEPEKDEVIISHLNRIKKDNIHVLTPINLTKYISNNEIFNSYLETPIIKQIIELGEKGVLNLQKEFYEIITKLT